MSCNMRFICVQCYWQRPKKDPNNALIWVRKCDFFSQGRAWCMMAAAQGTICYNVFAGHIFSLWNQGKYKKKQGAANNCLVGMHASLWFCHSRWGCLVIDPPSVFFLFDATTPLSRKAGIAQRSNHLTAGKTLLSEELLISCNRNAKIFKRNVSWLINAVKCLHSIFCICNSWCTVKVTAACFF